jgi:ABC-type multidrug transport system, ATPase component
MLAIETDNLSKNYHEFQALNNVNLKIESGSIYGFIGLNGAGKTTTMRILLNMIKASKGNAQILGQDISHVSAEFWNQVGYLIETPHAYKNMTVKENLDIYGELRMLSKHDRRKRINELMDILQLTQYKNTLVRDLSLGNNQKIGLIKALIHHPKILLLDEPTNGLDPTGLTAVRRLILDEAKNYGTTILISSHILDEMEKMVTEIGILNHGQLILQQSRNEFEKDARKTLHLKFSSASDMQAAKIVMEDIFVRESPKERKIEVPIIAEKTVNQVEQTLATNQIFPISNHVERESLEKYFLREIGEKQ